MDNDQTPTNDHDLLGVITQEEEEGLVLAPNSSSTATLTMDEVTTTNEAALTNVQNVNQNDDNGEEADEEKINHENVKKDNAMNTKMDDNQDYITSYDNDDIEADPLPQQDVAADSAAAVMEFDMTTYSYTQKPIGGEPSSTTLQTIVEQGLIVGSNTTSSTSHQTRRPNHCRHFLKILSNLLFFIGAVLYARMAVISLEYAIKYHDDFLVAVVSANGSGASNTTVVEYYLLYWNQLPPDVQDAATNYLGYTQNMWDAGETPAALDVSWHCLTTQQQSAATILGYNEAKWNGIDEEDYYYENEAKGEGEAGASVTNSTTTNEEEEEDYYEDECNPGTTSTTMTAATLDVDNLQEYVRLYYVASISFVLVGLFDWYLIRKWYPMLFVIAGMFGFVSALYVNRNVHISNVLNAISIHFFFLEALSIIWNRLRPLSDQGRSNQAPTTNNTGNSLSYSKWAATPLIVGDISFLIGSIIELVLSYYYIFDGWVDYNISINSWNVAAQSLWVVCSVIYTVFAITKWCNDSSGSHCCRRQTKQERQERAMVQSLQDVIQNSTKELQTIQQEILQLKETIETLEETRQEAESAKEVAQMRQQVAQDQLQTQLNQNDNIETLLKFFKTNPGLTQFIEHTINTTRQNTAQHQHPFVMPSLPPTPPPVQPSSHASSPQPQVSDS